MFYSNLKRICDEKGVKITPLVLECGGTKGIIGGWKKGTSPNSDIVMKIATKLNITTDELLFGKSKTFSSIDLSHSSVGSISETFSGTVNMPSSVPPKKSITSIEDETAQEILRILKNLSLKERTELLTMIYKFEENHKSKL